MIPVEVGREGDLETRDEDDPSDRPTTKVREKLVHIGLANRVVDHDREARLAVDRSLTQNPRDVSRPCPGPLVLTPGTYRRLPREAQRGHSHLEMDANR